MSTLIAIYKKAVMAVWSALGAAIPSATTLLILTANAFAVELITAVARKKQLSRPERQPSAGLKNTKSAKKLRAEPRLSTVT